MTLPDNILSLPLPLTQRVVLSYATQTEGDVPPVRTLAAQLNISRGQAHRALKELADAGYFEQKGYKKTTQLFELAATCCPKMGQQLSQNGTTLRSMADGMSQNGTVVERNERPKMGQNPLGFLYSCPKMGQTNGFGLQPTRSPWPQMQHIEICLSQNGTALQEGGVIEYNRNINTYKKNTNTVNTVETKDEKTPSEKAEKKKRTEPTEFDRKSAKAFRDLFRAWGLAVSGNQDAQHIRRLRASLPDDAEGHIRGAYLYLKSRGMASHGEHLVEIQSCRALKEKFAKLQAEMKRKSITHEQRNQKQFDPASRLAQLKASRQTGVSE